ncbi:MAG TPA: hypothetical protein VHM48_09485 [Candidatus Limnocylindrales bacterium]|nr:hypothetical protein [Candidatus Limnocylindrales bacterium]
MHPSFARRLAGFVAGLALLLSLGAPAALAKEGVEVTLVAPIPGDARPGDVVPVVFILATVSDSGAQPLRGSDVFFRLYGPTGAMTEAAGAEQSTKGTYKAMIAIPAGGAARAEFGLHGSATDASGGTVDSDMIWTYDGVLVAGTAPVAVQPRFDPGPGSKPAADPATTTSAPSTAPAGPSELDPRVPVVVGLAIGLAVAAGLAVGRRRRVDRLPA